MASADKFVEVKEALEEAHPNQLIIISILTENFGEIVNDDYIVEYIKAIFEDEEVELESMAEIKYAIDLVNATKAVEAAEEAVAEFDETGNTPQEEIDAAQDLYNAALELVEALDPEVEGLGAKLEAVETKIENEQDALDAMNDAIEAAEAALADHIATGGKEDDDAYVAVVEALAAKPRAIETIINVTDALVEATKQITADEDNAALDAVEKIIDENQPFADIDAIKAVVPEGIKVSVALTKLPEVGVQGEAKVTLTKNAQKKVIEKVELAHLILEAPEERVTVANNLLNVTEEGALFLVAGLVDDSNRQKPVSLAEVKAYMDETYDVDFNADAIKVTDGKIEIVGTILSTEDWNKVKASGNKTIPYRITLMQDGSTVEDTAQDSEKKVLKIAMYEDGVAVIEKIEK